MARLMYDGVNADRLPVTAPLVGGYVDGDYKWSDADWARFPNSIKVRIAVFAHTNDGHVLDVEPGNATPSESVDWVLMRRKAGIDPTVYTNTGTWPQVRSAFRARGVPEPHYWVAQYDNSAVIPTGAIGKQYYNNDSLGYDLSTVADHWPGIDPPQTATAGGSVISEPEESGMWQHFDLKPGEATVIVNPAAVTEKPATLLLGADFGDAVVRVALFSLHAATWTYAEHPVGRLSGAVKLALPPDTNKISLKLVSGSGVVGADILA